MFHAVEKFRTPAKIILVLITFSFVGFGAYSLSDIKSAQARATGPNIVRIGDTSVTEEELERIFDQQKAQQTEQDNFTDQDIRQGLFKTLERNAYLLEGAKNMGFGVSDEYLKAELKEIILQAPGFKNEKGEFSKEKFDEFLKSQNITEAKFTKQTLEEFDRMAKLEQVRFLFTAGQIQSDEQVSRLLAIQTTTKQVHTAEVETSKYLDKVTADEKTLKDFYEKNKEKFAQPETAKFKMIGVSAKDPKFAKQLAVNDSELNTVNDERHAAHILFDAPKDADAKTKQAAKDEAQKVLTELKANPEKFAELAKKHSKDPGSAVNGGDLGFFPKGRMVPEFDKKVFSMKKGEISDLVETDYGFHIIQLIDTKQTTLTPEEKERTKERLKQEKQMALFMKEAPKLEKYIGKDASELSKLEKELNVGISTLPQAASKNMLQRQGLSKEAIDEMFDENVTKNKKISKIVEIADGIMLVTASDVQPYKIRTFDEAKEQVEAMYKHEQASLLAEKAAVELVEKLKKGEKTDIVWSKEPQELKPEQFASMEINAAKSLMLVSGSPEKPGYVTSKTPFGALLVKVVGEKPIEAELATPYSQQLGDILNQANADFSITIFLNMLEEKITKTLGEQKSPFAQEKPEDLAVSAP